MDVVIVGGGHAGLVASWHLAQRGIDHVVLEAGRIGESWRSQRWDSFALNTPTALNRLPDDGDDPEPQDGFLLRDQWIARLEAWVVRHGLPVRTGVRVTGLAQGPAGTGFRLRIQGDGGGDGLGTLSTLSARAVVVASGMQRVPRLPAVAATVPAGVTSLHTADYRSPDALPPGGVLVVGCAQSGGQIAEDLLLAGRRVVVAASPVPRQPRRYRGRDTLDWFRRVGAMDMTVAQLPDPRMQFTPVPIISGVGRYGHTLSLQGLAARGATLMGRVAAFDGSVARFSDDLAASIRAGDAGSAMVRGVIDRGIAAQSLDAPPPEAAEVDPDDVPVADPDAVAAAAPRSLDLQAEGIRTVIWATGFGPDVAWLEPALVGADGRPIHDAGRGAVPGLWYLGIPWQRTRASGVVFGADRDGAATADAVVAHLG